MTKLNQTVLKTLVCVFVIGFSVGLLFPTSDAYARTSLSQLLDMINALTERVADLEEQPGETGAAGVSCWDLDEDLTCDLATEDKNNDDRCDASDCQGPPGTGAIQVYDSSNPPQYLGVLVDFVTWSQPSTTSGVTIFVPSLNKATIINRSDGYLINGPAGVLYFEDDNCQETPILGEIYLLYHDLVFQDLVFMYGDNSCLERMRFFTLSHSLTSFNGWQSSLSGGCRICARILGDGANGSGYEAIEIPKENIPFALPVTFPLIYEYQGE